MHADSLLRGVGRVAEQGEHLLSLRTLSGPDPSRRVDVAMGALVDLAELLRAGAPFPPRPEVAGRGNDSRVPHPDGGSRESSPDDTGTEDALVRRVLEVGDEHDEVTLEAFDPAVADRIADASRFETVGSRVVVPLSSAVPYARNWRPVIEALIDRVEDALEDFRRIVRRVRAAGGNGTLVTGCEAVVEMLETLALVVQRADADARYVRERTDHRQGELLTTVERAATQLRPQQRTRSQTRSDDNA
ncbi:hypothetical protein CHINAEXTREME_05845 [Halobiforma lacisalsi AJ5]|uniref:Uncharacterized protein n=1 Tax=Natronobacterium lacisalsi AJ5 TaxID=358396 RepID=M0LL80_NATLA|nr:hypothetical protein [Halobiforma lacisalsi]APW97324.1 hypothetical protein CHINAEXTREME_05845 [Halobiforma lacisalsi AJ5]EMA33838.1 hypothetical protein C445_09119 [Halobiforma lacisalsi AJ5]